MKIIVAFLLVLPLISKGQWSQSAVGAGRFHPVKIYHMNTDGNTVYFAVADTAVLPHQQAIYQSDNGGRDFSYTGSLSLQLGYISYVSALAQDTLLIVAQEGIMKKGADSVSKPGYMLRFTGYNNIYRPAVFFWGDSGVVIARHTYKTFNRGLTWLWDSTRVNPARLGNTQYIPASGRLIASSPVGLYQSRDLGITWDTLNASSVSALSMINDKTGYAYGLQSLLKTTDGGSSWTNVSNVSMLSSLCFVAENLGFRLTHGQHHVLVTADGTNWLAEQALGAQSRGNDRLYYFNDSMFFLTNNGNIYKRSRLSLNNIPDNNAFSVSVYPNPAADLLTVAISEGMEGFRYEVYDLRGRTVLSGMSHHNSETLSLTSLTPGVYTLFLKQDNHTGQYKIIKTR